MIVAWKNYSVDVFGKRSTFELPYTNSVKTVVKYGYSVVNGRYFLIYHFCRMNKDMLNGRIKEGSFHIYKFGRKRKGRGEVIERNMINKNNALESLEDCYDYIKSFERKNKIEKILDRE